MRIRDVHGWNTSFLTSCFRTQVRPDLYECKVVMPNMHKLKLNSPDNFCCERKYEISSKLVDILQRWRIRTDRQTTSLVTRLCRWYKIYLVISMSGKPWVAQHRFIYFSYCLVTGQRSAAVEPGLPHDPTIYVTNDNLFRPPAQVPNESFLLVSSLDNICGVLVSCFCVIPQPPSAGHLMSNHLL